MALQVFNTLTRNKEPFVPLNPPHVGLYTCGPTVYNYAHIGNLRAFTFQDLLRRYLEHSGYQVKHVMNITDIEDKIIRKVRETGRSLQEITTLYTEEFYRDLKTLGIKHPHVSPRATEFVPDMISMIETLISKKHAYVGEDGSVYYSIESFKDYGKLSRIRQDELRPGDRVKHDDYAKESAADFALWKAWDEDDGEVKWNSPWGFGRPGWHIECSVMSMKNLGQTFDIHCGGEDLIFPHHEDEIAQSEAATGKPFVRLWVHNSHLLVEGKKMSKSLGNFFTLRDLLSRNWSGREIRYVLLSAHYRDQLNFTFDGLHGARAALQRIDDLLIKLQDLAGTRDNSVSQSPDRSAEVEPLKLQFETSLDDDLNISAALGALFDFVRNTNKRLSQGVVTPSEAQSILRAWQRLDGVLGLGMPAAAEVPANVSQLVAERQAARESKNFKRADEIRSQLAEQGWKIEDTPQGARAKRSG